jgi:hypothetical protein
MSTEVQNGNQWQRSALRLIMDIVVPRALQSDSETVLDASSESGTAMLQKSAKFVASCYRMQAAAALDHKLLVAEVLICVFCLASVDIPIPLLIAFLAALIASLLWRDAYTFPFIGRFRLRPPKDASDKVPPGLRYLDSLLDGLTGAVSIMAVQVAALHIAPSVVRLNRSLFSASLICLAVVAALRAALRPVISPKPPFEDSNLSWRGIYRVAQFCNILWLMTCSIVIITNTTGLPAWIHVYDRFFGSVPVLTLGFWKYLQKEPLSPIRKPLSETKQKEMDRKLSKLLLEIDQDHPLYPLAVGLQLLLFTELGMPLLLGMQPWLAGLPADIQPFPLGINFVVVLTLLASWQHLKDFNRAAAEAMKKDLH